MGNYVDITIRVPSEQADHWIGAIQNIQENGVQLYNGFFRDPDHEVDSSDAEWLNCEIVKVRDRSKVFDVECVKEVLGTVKDALNIGTTIVGAVSSAVK